MAGLCGRTCYSARQDSYHSSFCRRLSPTLLPGSFLLGPPAPVAFNTKTLKTIAGTGWRGTVRVSWEAAARGGSGGVGV